jgi:hypothetical protein
MTSHVLSSDNPLDEIAVILAAGLLRLRLRQQEIPQSKVLLDLRDAPSMHGDETKTGESHA